MKLAIKPLILLLLLLAVAVPGSAAPDPVKWSARLEPAGLRAGEGGRVVLTATIEPGWHVYSMKRVEGPFPTEISMAPHQALIPAGKPVQPPGERVRDTGFGVDVEYYEGAVAFAVPVKVAATATGAQKAVVAVKYQTCNTKQCLPPKPLQVPVAFTVAAGAARPDHA